MLPVAAGVAAAAGAVLLLAGRRLGVLGEDARAKIQAIADSINRERSTDAYYFKLFHEERRKQFDLLFELKDVEAVLAAEEKTWEETHRNAESLEAAQAAVDRLTASQAEAARKAGEYRQLVEQAARNIEIYRKNAEAIISGLAAEDQAEARTIIDPCFRPSMGGSRIPTRPVGLFRF